MVARKKKQKNKNKNNKSKSRSKRVDGVIVFRGNTQTWSIFVAKCRKNRSTIWRAIKPLLRSYQIERLRK